MAKIVTVYNSWRRRFEPVDMSYIRWLKISQALARRGHQVDIATNELIWWLKKSPAGLDPNLRRVPLSMVKWDDYHVVKTLFHFGFDTLEAYGGKDHPFIISKLGSVVAPEDRNGIYFYGDERKRMYLTQEKIHRASAYVTVLSDPAKQLWQECFGQRSNLLVVPGGVDRDIPPPARNPYPADNRTRCLFAGNVYGTHSQREANSVLIGKLNQLGGLLARRGARMYVLGSGDVRGLDKHYVRYLGAASYEQTWDYFRFADVGIVVSAGKFQHNNESSKIYHYLRAGLPVVSEAGFPNDNVVAEARLGFVVENGNLGLMAEKIEEAAHKNWDRDRAVAYILNNHTWDKRVEVYDTILKSHFA
jgi:glycosyltransferase involved in cell wall biosynthesis